MCDLNVVLLFSSEVPQSIHEAVPDLTVNITDSGDGMALSESIDRRSLTPKSDSSDASFTSIIPSLTPVLNLPNHQPTETITSSSSVITNNYELFHGVIERIYAKPPTSKLHDLHHDPCIRRVAVSRRNSSQTSNRLNCYCIFLALRPANRFNIGRIFRICRRFRI